MRMQDRGPPNIITSTVPLHEALPLPRYANIWGVLMATPDARCRVTPISLFFSSDELLVLWTAG